MFKWKMVSPTVWEVFNTETNRKVHIMPELYETRSAMFFFIKQRTK